MSASPMVSRRAAPASPTDHATLRQDASSALALAAFHHRRGSHAAAARQTVLALKPLRKLASIERTTSASPCTNCRDNFPLPSGPLDFFDKQVVADYVTRRTACTKCPAAQKPCLKNGGAQ